MKLTLHFVTAVVASIVCLAGPGLMVRGETLSTKEVRKRWGEKALDEAIFRSGSTSDRASMAASLLENKKRFIGLGRANVRDRLGEFSGYYISGMYPTYLIHDSKTTGEDAWQVVFLIDNDGIVRDVVSQKNCCYKE